MPRCLLWLRNVLEKAMKVRTCPYPTLPLSNPPFFPKVADDIITSQVEAIVVSIESVATKLGLGEEPFPVRRPLFFLALTTKRSPMLFHSARIGWGCVDPLR